MNSKTPQDATEHSASLRFRAAGWAGGKLVRLLGRTWRIEWALHEESARLEAEGRPFLLAFWHEHILSLAYTHRDRGIVVLVSQSKDGEYISQVIHRLGMGTVRGSSSRGGVRALLQMAKRGREGHSLAVTPDGPRGPRHVVQPGLLSIAARSELPIIPLTTGARSSWRLGSWDRFEIPKPFTRLRVITGEPISIPSTASPESLERDYGPRVQAAMDEVEQRALSFAAGDPSR
jgi:lysophospholipid acyltransferase (LPLAT)-like uncharacterized protein